MAFKHRTRPRGTIKVNVKIERKHAELAAFVAVPAREVARRKLTATTTVEATLNGVPLGRGSLRRWDDERWFIELRRDHLEAVGKPTGDRATLVIGIASAGLPAELRTLIHTDPAARSCWEAQTEGAATDVARGDPRREDSGDP